MVSYCTKNIFNFFSGFQDADAPADASLLFMERLTTEDVDVILRKTGDHRLNSRDDHQLLLCEVDRLLKQNPVKEELRSSKL